MSMWRDFAIKAGRFKESIHGARLLLGVEPREGLVLDAGYAVWRVRLERVECEGWTRVVGELIVDYATETSIGTLDRDVSLYCESNNWQEPLDMVYGLCFAASSKMAAMSDVEIRRWLDATCENGSRYWLTKIERIPDEQFYAGREHLRPSRPAA